MPSSFFWYDVMTSDVEAAGRFYCDLVGWELQPQGHGYTVFTVDGLNSQKIGIAGLMAVPQDAAKMGAKPAWMGYIQVEDVAATCAAITAAGGTVHKGPVTVENVIIFAVVADPQGAGFLIAKPIPKEAPAWPAPGTPGTFGWRELFASDWKTVWPFYEKLFGWTKADVLDMGPMGTYQLFAAGGAPIGAMMNRPATVPAPFWNYYINVPSVRVAAEKIKAGGGQIAMGPHEVPGGQWILQGFDPQGAFFALLSSAQ